MNIEILNADRIDLASRMAQLDVGKLNFEGTNSDAWLNELLDMEKKHGYTVVEATIEYYVNCSRNAESVPLLTESVYCYLTSLQAFEEIAA